MATKKRAPVKRATKHMPSGDELQLARREGFLRARNDEMNGCSLMAQKGVCGSCEAQARALFPLQRERRK